MDFYYEEAISYLFTIPLILVTIIFLIVSLNVRGYVDVGHSAIFIYELHKWSMPGYIFDKTSSWRFLIPSTIHVIIVAYINY